MLFLIEYDRRRGELVSLETYPDSQRDRIEGARLAMELKLHNNAVEREVVLLEAPSEEALRKTHRRYFESLNTLAKIA